MKAFVISALVIVLMYISFAFVIGDLNAFNWTEGTRFGFVTFSALGAFISYYSYQDLKE